jgi:hypothetical protein
MGWPGRRVGVLAGVVGLVGAPLGVLVVMSSPAAAATATITVDNSGDGSAVPTNCAPTPVAGACTLRDAFAAASTAGADDGDDVVIDIPASVGTITLTAGSVNYDGGTGGHTMTLNGNGNTINQTTANARVINDTAATLLTVNGLTITGGHAPAGQAGGGILVQGAATVTNSIITGNAAPDSAGGIRVSNGNLILTNSTISKNVVVNSDGGAFVNGNATVTNSTISGNTAGKRGGGLEAMAITVTNSTISGNTAGQGGGGVLADGSVTLVYATVVGNSAPTGANVDPVSPSSAVLPLVSFGSVVALPGGGGANCAGLTGTTSHGFNLEDDAAASCKFSTATGDSAPGTSSGLAGVVLANNGGSTLTLLPPSGSALIDAIPPAHCSDDGAAAISPLVDQVGLSRPQGAGCEIGAKEVPVVAAAPPLVVTPSFTG